VLGEWLGLFDVYTERVPWPIGLAVVLIGAIPYFAMSSMPLCAGESVRIP